MQQYLDLMRRILDEERKKQTAPALERKAFLDIKCDLICRRLFLC